MESEAFFFILSCFVPLYYEHSFKTPISGLKTTIGAVFFHHGENFSSKSGYCHVMVSFLKNHYLLLLSFGSASSFASCETLHSAGGTFQEIVGFLQYCHNSKSVNFLNKSLKILVQNENILHFQDKGRAGLVVQI